MVATIKSLTTPQKGTSRLKENSQQKETMQNNREERKTNTANFTSHPPLQTVTVKKNRLY